MNKSQLLYTKTDQDKRRLKAKKAGLTSTGRIVAISALKQVYNRLNPVIKIV